MRPNDETPVSFTLLKSVHLVFVLEDGGIVFKLFDALGPIDESVLIESLDWEIHGLV